MANLPQLHKTLLTEFNKPKPNVATVEQILHQTSEAMCNESAWKDLDHKALSVITKDVHEITALVAALKGDMPAFGDAIQQVLAFYESLNEHTENKLLMQGLNLMFFLATNKLANFHVLLEQIPQETQTNSPFISTPVRLEQSLMEGSYNKVVLTEKNIPSPYYTVFIRKMLDAVRADIAASIEKSFKMLSTKDAAGMLLFDTEVQVHEFAKLRQWSQDGSCFVFESPSAAAKAEAQTLDTSRIAKQTIYYAKQLEMIV